jgi:hypothetical protein
LLDIEPFKGPALVSKLDKAKFSLGRGLQHFAPVVAVISKYSGILYKTKSGNHVDWIRVSHSS